MKDITITKKNEAFVYIDAEPSILMELSEHFCFYVPGYKFMPKFKNKLWDGKIRLFNSFNQTLPRGLIYQVPEFAKARGYTVGVQNNPHYGYVGEREAYGDLIKFVDSLKLTSGDKDIYPHDYQLDAIGKALEDYGRLLLSPTASGKSLIIYIIAQYILHNYNNKVLIVVPTTSLVEQMTKDFLDYSQKIRDTFDEESVHKIYSGKEKYRIESPIVITTWQSVYKMNPQWFQMFDCVIGDEAHTFKAVSLNKIMEKLTEAKFRIGTTGTLDGENANQLTLEGHFGQVYKVITTKELMNRGVISQLHINSLILNHNQEDRKLVKKLDYPQEMEFITQHEKRNKFITNLATDLDGNTIVLYRLVKKHGEPLFKMIQNKVDEEGLNRKVYFVAGGTAVDQRERIRELTEKNRGCIIVASVGTFATGINIKNLHNIIFTAPYKSIVKVLQSIGRVLRLSDDSVNANLFDIIDDLSVPSRKNSALKHGQHRIEVYQKENFDYKIFKINM